MAYPASWRRTRQFFRHFRIDAPRMAVRSHLPWPWRAVAVAVLVAIVGGMWWWGFDFGRIFGGFNRKEIEARISTLEAENARLRAESDKLRAKNSQQESDLAMTQGAQVTLSKQTMELAGENSQLKEELTFLQKLVADSNKQTGLSIQRLEVERESDDAFHYRLLIVRGGNPKDDFEGRVTLQASVLPQQDGGSASHPTTVTLPDAQPESAAALNLRFKYYQRVEGTIRVPPGAQVRSVTVRAFETGQATPRATKTLVIQ